MCYHSDISTDFLLLSSYRYFGTNRGLNDKLLSHIQRVAYIIAWVCTFRRSVYLTHRLSIDYLSEEIVTQKFV